MPGSTVSATSLSGVCSLPARTASSPVGGEHRAEQPHGRRLSLRAGDPDQRVAGEQAIPELDLAPHRDPAGARVRHGRRLARHSWALHDDVDVLQQVLLLGPEQDFDTRPGKPAGVRIRPAVGRANEPPARRERERGGPARAAQTDDQRPAHYFLWNSSGWKSKKYW